jgi:hypothetical protein
MPASEPATGSTDQPTAAAASDDPAQIEVAHGKDVTVAFETSFCDGTHRKVGFTAY